MLINEIGHPECLIVGSFTLLVWFQQVSSPTRKVFSLPWVLTIILDFISQKQVLITFIPLDGDPYTNTHVYSMFPFIQCKALFCLVMSIPLVYCWFAVCSWHCLYYYSWFIFCLPQSSACFTTSCLISSCVFLNVPVCTTIKANSRLLGAISNSERVPL